MSFFKDVGKKLRGEKEAAKPAPVTEDLVLNALRQVQDPDLGKDIVSLNFIKNLKIEGTQVSFTLQLTTPACPVKEELKSQCETVVNNIDGIEKTTVTLSSMSEERVKAKTSLDEGHHGIKQIIAVASGKGGVGKSTVAIQLARYLNTVGAKVGILDADIYGPSIPIMSGVGKPEAMKGKLIIPPEVSGIKVISATMFSGNEKAHIMRGPMAANMVGQFLKQVDWGPLDYLIIDYPPGTGDIQLTLSQIARVSGAIIVSTPQEVALSDVRKSIEMFHTLKVPILGIVENMSYFVCDNCDKKHTIFKQGGAQKLAKQMGLPLLGEVPLDPAVNEQADKGLSLSSLSKDQPPISKTTEDAYKKLADLAVRELAKINHQSSEILSSFSLIWRSK